MSASVAVDTHRSLARSVLRDAVDLYVSAAAHDRIEMRTFGALVDGLLDDARADERRYVAETLAARDDVPVELMRRLAADVAEVARPVIVASPLLEPNDLAAALRRGANHVRAVAERLAPILAREEPPATIETPEPEARTEPKPEPTPEATTKLAPEATTKPAPEATGIVETRSESEPTPNAMRAGAAIAREPARTAPSVTVTVLPEPPVVEPCHPIGVTAPTAVAAIVEPIEIIAIEATPDPAATPRTAAEIAVTATRREAIEAALTRATAPSIPRAGKPTAPEWMEAQPAEVIASSEQPTPQIAHPVAATTAAAPVVTEAATASAQPAPKPAILPHFAVPVRGEPPRAATVETGDERPAAVAATSFFDLDSAGRWRAVQEAAAAAAVAGPVRRRSGLDAAAMGDRLFAAAVAHDLPVMTLLIGDALDIDVPMAGRVLGDASGEPMAVALAAIGIEERRATSILLHLAGAGVSLEHMQDLAAMAGRIGRRTAEQLVAGWRAEARSRAVPRRVVDPAERRPAPSAAPAERREVPAITTGSTNAVPLERRDASALDRRDAPSVERREAPSLERREAGLPERRDAVLLERRDAPGPRTGERGSGDALREALDRLARRISQVR